MRVSEAVVGMVGGCRGSTWNYGVAWLVCDIRGLMLC